MTSRDEYEQLELQKENQVMNELQKIEPMPMALPEPTTPAALMRRATDVAGVCREIVLKTACTIQGRKFVKVEGWESIATAHGCFVGAEDAVRAYDKEGNHIGYEAKSIMRNSHGEIIATGEGFVGFDEKGRDGKLTWKNRAEYAGRAMAQTRAISRVCRSVFAHVVVLIDAGLSTTPAEEVPEGGFDDAERASKAKPANVPRETRASLPDPAEPASEEQRIRWVKQLKAIERQAEAYGYAEGLLLPPANDFPGEPVECWPLKATPSTKWAADKLFAKIKAFVPHGTEGTQNVVKPSQSDSGNVGAPEKAQNAPETAKQANTGAQGTSCPKCRHVASQSEALVDTWACERCGWQWDKAGKYVEAHAWQMVICPIPPKGLQKKEYDRAPLTLGQISRTDSKRFYGLVMNNQEAKGWTGRDGKKHPPSAADEKFADACRQAVDHMENHKANAQDGDNWVPDNDDPSDTPFCNRY